MKSLNEGVHQPIQGEKAQPWADIMYYFMEYLSQDCFQPCEREKFLPTEESKHNLISSVRYTGLAVVETAERQQSCLSTCLLIASCRKSI